MELESILRSRLADPDPVVRRIALIELVDETDPDTAEPFLISALQDANKPFV